MNDDSIKGNLYGDQDSCNSTNNTTPTVETLKEKLACLLDASDNIDSEELIYFCEYEEVTDQIWDLLGPRFFVIGTKIYVTAPSLPHGITSLTLARIFWDAFEKIESKEQRFYASSHGIVT
jgi:hypothetical protein